MYNVGELVSLRDRRIALVTSLSEGIGHPVYVGRQVFPKDLAGAINILNMDIVGRADVEYIQKVCTDKRKEVHRLRQEILELTEVLMDYAIF